MPRAGCWRGLRDTTRQRKTCDYCGPMWRSMDDHWPSTQTKPACFERQRNASVKRLEQANEYLEKEYLPWWDRTLTVPAARNEDAHRPLEENMNLAATLSRVETRQVDNGYTLRLDGKRYRITNPQVTVGLRKADVRVEWRLDGSIAVRHQERYLTVELCTKTAQPVPVEVKPKSTRKKATRG